MSIITIRSKVFIGIISITIASVMIVLLFSIFPGSRVLSQTGSSIIGYMWSDNIGWIDMNCLNASTCGTNSFGMSVDSAGNLSGYAWSDNIGWVSANATDLTGCPSSPCTATLTGTTLVGWFKALASSDAQAGGWDGFISLSGVTYNSGTNYFSGYAWGDSNVGWADFSRVREACPISYSCSGNQVMQTTATCQTVVYSSVCSYPTFCSTGSNICLYPQPAGTITVSPKLVAPGKTVTVSWSISGVSTTSNPCTVVSSVNALDSWTGASSTRTSHAITSQTTFTLSCTPVDPGATNPFILTTKTNLVPNFVEK